LRGAIPESRPFVRLRVAPHAPIGASEIGSMAESFSPPTTGCACITAPVTIVAQSAQSPVFRPTSTIGHCNIGSRVPAVSGPHRFYGCRWLCRSESDLRGLRGFNISSSPLHVIEIPQESHRPALGLPTNDHFGNALLHIEEIVSQKKTRQAYYRRSPIFSCHDSIRPLMEGALTSKERKSDVQHCIG
jgi:hypothetical protein